MSRFGVIRKFTTTTVSKRIWALEIEPTLDGMLYFGISTRVEELFCPKWQYSRPLEYHRDHHALELHS